MTDEISGLLKTALCDAISYGAAPFCRDTGAMNRMLSSVRRLLRADGLKMTREEVVAWMDRED